jgi:uncharacterized membrane protein
MATDLTIVTFHGQPAAAMAFGALRGRAGDAAWTHEAALVEHHRHKDQLVLHGTIAGHYISVDEADHISQSGGAKGALVGGLIGVLFLGGPVGLAPGLVLGAAVGASNGRPDEVEKDAGALGEQLRAAVPKGSSAIVVLAESDHSDELVALIGEGDGEVTRRTLSADELATIESAVAEAPMASAGPSTDGDSHSDGEITAA